MTTTTKPKRRLRPDVGPCWHCMCRTYWQCERCNRYLCSVCRGGKQQGDYSAAKEQVCPKCCRESIAATTRPTLTAAPTDEDAPECPECDGTGLVQADDGRLIECGTCGMEEPSACSEHKNGCGNRPH